MGQPPRTSAGFVGQQDPVRTQGRVREEKIWNFDYPAAAKIFKTATDTLGTQRHDYVPNAPQWRQHRSAAGFGTLQKVQRRGQWQVFNSFTR